MVSSYMFDHDEDEKKELDFIFDNEKNRRFFSNKTVPEMVYQNYTTYSVRIPNVLFAFNNLPSVTINPPVFMELAAKDKVNGPYSQMFAENVLVDIINSTCLMKELPPGSMVYILQDQDSDDGIIPAGYYLSFVVGYFAPTVDALSIVGVRSRPSGLRNVLKPVVAPENGASAAFASGE